MGLSWSTLWVVIDQIKVRSMPYCVLLYYELNVCTCHGSSNSDRQLNLTAMTSSTSPTLSSTNIIIGVTAM